MSGAGLNARAHAIMEQKSLPRILFWHWGRGGAGSKFTFELIRAVRASGRAEAFLSAVAGCELAGVARGMQEPLPLDEIHTFDGDKATLKGKIAAAFGLVNLPKIGRQFDSYLEKNRIDVAVCTMLSIWDIAVLNALKRRDMPFILIVHDAQPHPGDSYPFRTYGWRRIFAAADRLVVLSDHVRRQLTGLYGVPNDRICSIPHGAFDFGAGRPRKLPRDRPVRLLFLGRILAYKGLGLLLEAYRMLRADGVAVELDIVGSGDLRPYAALWQLDGVRAKNRWLDETDIAAALLHSDLLILPYVEASQSGVAPAAASAGLPVVATPVGGLEEQVRHGVTGLIAESTAPASLAAAIRRLIEDDALYARCSSGALAHARDELGWDAIAVKLTGIAVAAAREREDGKCLS